MFRYLTVQFYKQMGSVFVSILISNNDNSVLVVLCVNVIISENIKI